MTSFRPILVLLLALAFLLLAAGCTSQPQTPAAPASTTTADTLAPITTQEVITTIPPAVSIPAEPETIPVTATSRKPESSPVVTVALSNDYYPEYIRMDATTYSVGEVVEFFLVNKGPEIKGCDYAHPAYTIYSQSPDGSRIPVSASDPARAYRTIMSGSEPASATGPFSLDTSKLSAGNYLIRFDCGNNVAREFKIMARP
ncbi:MAG: hypothetical protein WC379_01845 [Methanoregula sp.]|jgi:hypothetical protein